MKKFFCIDFWVQLILIISFFIFMLIEFIANMNIESFFYYFHFIVGGFQLLSFLIRVIFKYKKSIIFKIYGFFILPIWIILFLAVILQGASIDLKQLNQIAGYFLLYLYLSLFFTPFFALVYVYYSYSTYKNSQNI